MSQEQKPQTLPRQVVKTCGELREIENLNPIVKNAIEGFADHHPVSLAEKDLLDPAAKKGARKK